MSSSSSPLRPVIDLREILELSDGIFSSVGLLLNFLLLYLIIRKTSSRFKDYRKLLLQNCITDLIYNLAHFSSRAQVEYKNGTFFLFITSAFGRIPLPYNTILGCIFLFTAYACVLCLPVQFIYRYFLIVKNIKITNRQYCLMLLTTIFFPFLYFIASLYIFWPTDSDYYEKAKLLESDVFYWREIPNYMTSDIRYWPFLVIVSYATVLISAAYGIVVWTSYKVLKHLRNMENHMTVQTRDVNQQMTMALIIQAALPLFVLLLPIAVTIVMLFARANVGGIGISVSLLLSWIPIVNSLITITVVKSYRNAMIKILCCPFKRNRVMSASTRNRMTSSKSVSKIVSQMQK